MNTILITGTANNIGVTVNYNVAIWASKSGEPIQFLYNLPNFKISGYTELWREAKSRVREYFKDDSCKFDDGAYTQYLDHLILISPLYTLLK